MEAEQTDTVQNAHNDADRLKDDLHAKAERVTFRALEFLFPTWARPGHAVFRWEIERRKRGRRFRIKWLDLLSLALFSFVMVAIIAGVVHAHEQGEEMAANMSGWPWWVFLLMPMLLLRMGVAANAADVVNREVLEGTWDDVRATSMDTHDILGAKWSATLWMSRRALGWMMALRAVFVLLLLADMSRFRGHNLTFLIDSSQPALPWVLGLFVVAAGMAFAVMQPAVSAGLDAALGVLVSTGVKNRLFARLIAALFPLVVWTVAAVVSWSVVDTLNWELVTTLGGWLLVLLFTVEADMGFGLLTMDWLIQLYGGVDWGFAIGSAALVWMLVQAALTGGLLWLAARRASRIGDNG